MTEATDSTGFGWLSDMRFILGCAFIAFMLVIFSVVEAWSLSQTATRTQVAATIGRLDPSCRTIVGMRMQTRLVEQGRPLTRGEMKEVVEGVKSCNAINAQLSGLTDNIE